MPFTEKPTRGAPTSVEEHTHVVKLPPDIEARVRRAAAADDRRACVFLRRFIIANIDVIDPPADDAGDTEAE